MAISSHRDNSRYKEKIVSTFIWLYLKHLHIVKVNSKDLFDSRCFFSLNGNKIEKCLHCTIIPMEYSELNQCQYWKKLFTIASPPSASYSNQPRSRYTPPSTVLFYPFTSHMYDFTSYIIGLNAIYTASKTPSTKKHQKNVIENVAEHAAIRLNICFCMHLANVYSGISRKCFLL